jgi:hypothetical protein
VELSFVGVGEGAVFGAVMFALGEFSDVRRAVVGGSSSASPAS